MTKSTRNNGKLWTSSDRAQLRDLAAWNTPTRVTGIKMGRSEDAIRSQAQRQSTSLKPTNQSPYNRTKK